MHSGSFRLWKIHLASVIAGFEKAKFWTNIVQRATYHGAISKNHNGLSTF